MKPLPPRAWTALALAACLAACDARLPEPDSPGARLYARRCGGCHRLYAPGVMTFEMWKVMVARMQGELARRGVPTLTREEEDLLLTYLRRHAADAGKGGSQ